MLGSFPGTSGQDSGSQGSSSQSGGGRDTAGGQVSGAAGSGSSGNYSLDNLPGSIGDSGTGPLTAQERAAVLEGQLNRGYEEFDGVILAERARAQAEANAARNTEIPGDSDAGGGGGGPTGPIIISSRGGGSPTDATVGSPGVGGGPTAAQSQESFPPPEDIPSGRDDDIVARQLREAAMHEPDPELREKLWDEYRKYTGISN
ncbi:MAG: hypothetical protein KDI28_06810 [Pseudomonadales bacterium]|nr:hypothetical protein [Pseudomonadales bacterium]MCP5357672.1 hypothetical protein [Pseudomonadales bacterium]